MVKLADNELHIWLVDLDAVDPGLLPGYRDLMSDDEIERNQRYRFETGKLTDCVTRALVRTTLSRYADIDPAEWQFVKGEHGKPEISSPRAAPPLRFNLSHTRRFIACAVGLNMDLGIDIESTNRNNDVLNIADRYFSCREVDDLFQLAESRQYDRFFDYWTLKEAFMKARGEGLSLGLGNFSFTIPTDAAIAISFSAQLEDNPADWQFALMNPAPHHRMAYAVRQSPEVPVSLQVFETLPLTSHTQILTL